jgi:hypothetical protein
VSVDGVLFRIVAPGDAATAGTASITDTGTGAALTPLRKRAHTTTARTITTSLVASATVTRRDPRPVCSGGD